MWHDGDNYFAMHRTTRVKVSLKCCCGNRLFITSWHKCTCLDVMCKTLYVSNWKFPMNVILRHFNGAVVSSAMWRSLILMNATSQQGLYLKQTSWKMLQLSIIVTKNTQLYWPVVAPWPIRHITSRIRSIGHITSLRVWHFSTKILFNQLRKCTEYIFTTRWL